MLNASTSVIFNILLYLTLLFSSCRLIYRHLKNNFSECCIQILIGFDWNTNYTKDWKWFWVVIGQMNFLYYLFNKDFYYLDIFLPISHYNRSQSWIFSVQLSIIDWPESVELQDVFIPFRNWLHFSVRLITNYMINEVNANWRSAK